MKKAIILRILLLAMAASLASLYGCDEKKDDGSTLMMLLGFANRALTVSRVTTADGATGVAVDANLVIKFNRPTDGSTAGTVFFGSTNYTSGSATVTGWSYNEEHTILTITRADKYITNTKYENLTVTGFVDEDGIVMDDYHDMLYAFTTVPLKVVSITPSSGTTGVAMPVDVVITFDGDLDATADSQRAMLTCTTGVCIGGSPAFNIGSGEIDISGSTVTVHTTVRLVAGERYSNLILEFFKAADGGSLPTNTISGYNFTTAP